MEKRASFIINKVVRTPYVVDTNLPHKPRLIKYKKFKPGDMITGTGKCNPHGKPMFVLVGGTLVIPMDAVSELVTKEIVSDFSGKSDVKKVTEAVKKGNPKTKYIDGAIIGAVLGLGVVILAEKRQWISVPTKQNKIYGAVIGAGILAYIVYRIRNKDK